MSPWSIRPALLALPATLLGVALACWLFQESRLRPPAGPPVQALFVVEAGASLGGTARALEASGLVRSADALIWQARLTARADMLQAGEYNLSSALGSREILKRLVQGRVATHVVVIPEGLRLEQVAERLHAAGLARREVFLELARDPEQARALGIEGETLEGYLFPDTYRFARGLSTRRVAQAMVAQFLKAWQPLAARAEELGLSMKEAVTLASIIEKETGSAGERGLISSVFHNRLARGMRLQTDPSVIYGIPDFDGNLRRIHLQDRGNPYNTYVRKGLPPGPIAGPGAAALHAALYPEQSDYLYFVSRGDGTHVFSRSYEEHQAAVVKFQLRRRRR